MYRYIQILILLPFLKISKTLSDINNRLESQKCSKIKFEPVFGCNLRPVKFDVRLEKVKNIFISRKNRISEITFEVGISTFDIILVIAHCQEVKVSFFHRGGVIPRYLVYHMTCASRDMVRHMSNWENGSSPARVSPRAITR